MSTPLSTPSLSRVGMIVEGKYEVLRLLGAGGMGEVYEARHLQITRRVALKFLLPDIAEEPALLERFRNEARAAGALEHENVAAVYDMGVAADGAPYFVMEYLEGSDCAAVLESVKTFNRWRAANVIMQVCRGLAVAHAVGIVHRDLKPANLFLCRRGDGAELVKILDFGIAKLRRARPVDHSTGAILGTPFYMSPERARGEPNVDHRADIYALGVILYELLSGERPHDGTSALQILHSVLLHEPTPLAELRRDTPAALCAVVHRAMAKSPEDRFASVADLERALQPFAAFGALSAPAASVADFDVTMPEVEPSRTETDAPITRMVARADRLNTDAAGRRRKLATVTAAFVAAAALAAGILGAFRGWFGREDPHPPKDAAADVVPIVRPAEPPAVIDRPIDRSPPPAGEDVPSEPAAPVVPPTAAPRRVSNRVPSRTRPNAHGSAGAPASPSPIRLKIDRESPYQ